MSTTLTPTPADQAPAAPAAEPGIQLPCPHCGEASACVTLRLASMTEFRCEECDAEFTRADVETFIAKWSKLLKWLDLAPAE